MSWCPCIYGSRPASVTRIPADHVRTQNALPVWYTHSTVTGSATALGIKSDGSDQAGPSSRKFSTDGGEPKRDLADYYANLEEEDEEEEEELGTPVNVGGTPVPISERVKVEPGLEDEQDEEQEDVGDSLDATPVPGANGTEGEAMVMGESALRLPLSTLTSSRRSSQTIQQHHRRRRGVHDGGGKRGRQLVPHNTLHADNCRLTKHW